MHPGLKTSQPSRSLSLWPRLLLLAWALFTGTSAEDVLKQVIVVTRHGSRYPLQKAGSDLLESSSGRLTAFGQKQLYDLGKDLYDNYNQEGFLDQFYPDKVRLESSSYERTITSANSFALGLFELSARDPTLENLLPTAPANVPVYTIDRDNDILIRAYDKCPALHDKLEQLYQSEEWQRIENDNSQFLAQLAETTQFHPYSNNVGIIPLSELWNVYDAIYVAKTECTGQEQTPTCQSLPNPEVANILTDAQWLELQNLSHDAELKKYGAATSGKFIGINLLLEILARMQSDDYQFSLFSAHYPTILGIFSALDKAFFSEEVIPNYGAALIFEVTERVETGQRFFKLVYKGDDQLNGSVITVSLDHICQESLSCPVESLAAYLADWDKNRWCAECNNESANVCLKLKLASSQSADCKSNSNENEDDGDDGDDDGQVSAYFLGAVAVVGMLLSAAFAVGFYRFRLQIKEQRAQDSEVATAAAENSTVASPPLSELEQLDDDDTDGGVRVVI